MEYCIEMVIIFKIWILRILKNSKKFKTKLFFQKFISRKLLVLERSGLHHRVENIEKFLPYKFRRRDHTAGARTQLPNNKMETIISPGWRKKPKQ